VDPEAQTVEALFLERGVYQLVGRWQKEEQAASRLLKGFNFPVKELFGGEMR
jgi:hypothetical protein